MREIAVCDDLHEDAEQVCDIIAGIPEAGKATAFFAPETLLERIQTGWRPAVVLLDIKMDRMDGIKLAEEILRVHPACRVIFITEHLGYAPDVYAVRHSNFVLKSQMKERLGEALKRALDEAGRIDRLCFAEHGTLHIFKSEQVLYMERKLRKTIVCTDMDCIESSEHPENILARSDGKLFCRCHNSFWVNMERVALMKWEYFEMDNGNIVPISRKYRQEVKTQFFEALHRELESAVRK